VAVPSIDAAGSRQWESRRGKHKRPCISRVYAVHPVVELERAVGAVIQDCLRVQEDEDVLVVCNPATQEIGERMRAEAAASGAEAVLAVMDERSSHGEEPPLPIAAAMLRADVVLAPTMQSLSHTAARRAATEAGARVATLPGVTEEMLARVMSADMDALRRRGHAIADALTRTERAVITCPNGSRLEIDLRGREGIPDAGELTDRGAFGNLPCGEGFISPADARGTLVVDGSIAQVGRVKAPVTLTVEAARLVDADGAEGVRLLELLRVHGPNGTVIAELGIGTNEHAILTGEILEDEKILGTCHVAFGASAGIGGTIQVPVHLDCVVMRPTVTLDDHPIVSDGELLV
jgi:leucyl aminopeptidase (aminopeptidase T)